MNERRHVVRESDHPYARYWYGTRWSTNQSGACVYTLVEARSLRKDMAAGAVIRRLVSRREAVERVAKRARRKALEEAAAMLDRCAQSQDQGAWEAAQASLSALVAKHETVAGAYRLAAKSIRAMLEWR